MMKIVRIELLVLLLVGGGRSHQDAEAQAQAVHREQEPGDRLQGEIDRQRSME